eukprot:Gb_07479 [translate_table: standard]
MAGGLFAVVLWLCIGVHVTLQSKHSGKNIISRDDFPPGFVFGAGSSSYQTEGAAAIDGRKPSIWDTYTYAGNMFDGSTGDVAADQYHHYKEDVGLMHKMGLDAYRFSISWSRLIPDGRGAINPKGLQYYNNLINELISHGIEPHITLYHFDLPQSLEDAYDGWLSPQIVEDFTAYAEVCFREFGDRVKSWTTLNEPNIFIVAGYDNGFFPPQRCSYPFDVFGNCTAGDSTVEPYLAGHYALLSHVAVVELYRKKYQAKQKGSIGLVPLANWFVPLTNSSKDIAATQRVIDFQLGCTCYVSHVSNHWNPDKRDYSRDMSATLSVERDGIPIGKLVPSGLTVVPWGMQALLDYFKQRYDNAPIIIYENGYAAPNNNSIPLSEALKDKERVDFLHDYLENVLAAIRSLDPV